MKEYIKNLKFAWQYCKDQKTRIIIFMITNILIIITGIIIPVINAQEILKLTNNQIYQFVIMGVIVFLAYSLKELFLFIVRKQMQIIYRETYIKMQTELGKEILKLENKSLDKNSSGVFIQRLTGDVSVISDSFNLAFDYLTDFLQVVGIFLAILILNFWVFLFCIFMTIMLSIFKQYQTNIFKKDNKEYKKAEEEVTGFTGEVVRGARDIKMLNAEKSFMKIMKEKITNMNQKAYIRGNHNKNYNLIGSFIINSIDLGTVILLAVFILKGKLEVATALVLYNYSFRVTDVSYIISGFLSAAQNFNLSCERVIAIINDDEFKKETFGNKHLNKVDGNFEFQNVSFAYDDKEVLNNLSFKINANETVAFVGKSGAGKTTIFNLLTKMYNVNSGKILIDGVNINELDKDTIRGNITVISQNPYIFNLSIKENLKLVKEDLTDEEMHEACKIACLEEFINTLPDKYDTIVGEGGISLSGGQKQRLAIARALVQKTEIILFDEATSALDNETQYEIQKAIQNMQGKYTILMIAHRLSTIINSDRILFLNNGQIEAEGTHQTLLQTSENYRHLYETEIKTGHNK